MSQHEIRGNDTAPLFFYYAFLNLAKARCEIKRPSFHRRSENYRHGLSWKPKERFMVDPKTDSVSV